MTFDLPAAKTFRRAHPQLTVFDTGEALEPFLHMDDGNRSGVPRNARGNNGSVYFLDADGQEQVAVSASPSTLDEGTTVVTITSKHGNDITVIVDGTAYRPVIATPTIADLLSAAIALNNPPDVGLLPAGPVIGFQRNGT